MARYGRYSKGHKKGEHAHHWAESHEMGYGGAKTPLTPATAPFLPPGPAPAPPGPGPSLDWNRPWANPYANAPIPQAIPGFSLDWNNTAGAAASEAARVAQLAAWRAPYLAESAQREAEQARTTVYDGGGQYGSLFASVGAGQRNMNRQMGTFLALSLGIPTAVMLAGGIGLAAGFGGAAGPLTVEAEFAAADSELGALLDEFVPSAGSSSSLTNPISRWTRIGYRP